MRQKKVLPRLNTASEITERQITDRVAAQHATVDKARRNIAAAVADRHPDAGTCEIARKAALDELRELLDLMGLLDAADEDSDDGGEPEAAPPPPTPLRASEQDWRHRGACRPATARVAARAAERWHPISDTAAVQVDEAKQICSGCPVRTQCLEWALSDRWTEGVWGGTTEAERRAIRRQRAREAAQQVGEAA